MPNLCDYFFNKRDQGKKSKRKKRQDEETSDIEPGDGIGALEVFDSCGRSADGVDLVFVHGLRGSRVKTWSKGDVFWPRDLLKDDLEKARVIAWGYDADIANVFSYASKESLFGHGETLLADLSRIRQGITRPLIFICHSLGGLVVKEALITSASYKSHGRHLGRGEIYASTIGLVFMGTPHRGSSKESYGDIAASVARLSFRQPNKQLLRTLKPDSHILERQRDGFTTVSNEMNIICVREELPTPAGMIVPEASASYDGFNVTRGSIRANHMDMVRFSSRDEGYKRTLGYIESILGAKTPEVFRENEVIQSRIDAILTKLWFPTMDSREEGIDEAYADTCSWILDSRSRNHNSESGDDEVSTVPSQFLSWLQNNETYFWVSGKAGCGKSTLMKYVYQDKRTEAALRNSQWTQGKDVMLIGYFFFERGNKDQKSREGMLRSILHQVLRTRRELIPIVFPRWRFFEERHLQGNDSALKEEIPEDFLDWSILKSAFMYTLDQLQDSIICLFLDGLDEYRMVERTNEYTEEQLDLIYDGGNEDEGWGQSTWITDGHKEIADFLHSLKTYGNVKICLSSRELNIFEQEFRDFTRIMVHEHTAEPIARYCRDRLTEKTPDLMELSEFASAITKKSCGVFLWVRLVVDMLVDGYSDGNSKEELLGTLDRLPERLGGKNGLYSLMIRNIKHEYLPESKRLFQLALRWSEESNHRGEQPDIITLFLAEQGHCEKGSDELRAQRERHEAKTWDELQPKCKELSRRLKSRCAGLLERTKPVQFMHQTAKQFLSRKYIWDTMFQSTVGFASTSEIDLALMSGCIRRLKSCAEAVITIDNFPPDLACTSIDKSVDPFEGFTAEVFGSELFQLALDHALFMAHTTSITTDEIRCPYVELLDELDNTGCQLITSLRGIKKNIDFSWMDVLFKREISIHHQIVQPWDFLQLAIWYGLFPYVEEKVKRQGLSKSQLAPLLLVGQLGCTDILWRLLGFGIWRLSDPRMVEVLLREGADPNFPNMAGHPTFAQGDKWTIWTSYLQGTLHYNKEYIIRSEYLLVNWIRTTKHFLKYGADPEVRWYEREYPDGYDEEKPFTPEIVIRELLSDRPQHRKDLDELMELLRQAKGKGLEERPST